jgi:hypothetical protein
MLIGHQKADRNVETKDCAHGTSDGNKNSIGHWHKALMLHSSNELIYILSVP